MVGIDVERVGRTVAFVLHEGSSGCTVAPHYCRQTMTRLFTGVIFSTTTMICWSPDIVKVTNLGKQGNFFLPSA